MTQEINFYAKTIVTQTNLILNFNFNGAQDSTVFTDLSTYGNPTVAFGGAIVDTAQSISGGASVKFGGGATNQLRISDAEIFSLGTAGFYIDFYYWAISTGGGLTKALLSQWGDGGGSGSIYIFHTLAGSSQNMRFSYTSSGLFGSDVEFQWGDPSPITITTGTWVHLAAQRIGTTINFYSNYLYDKALKVLSLPGSLEFGTGPTATYTIGTVSINNSNLQVNISSYQDGASANQAINGYIDDLYWYKEISPSSEANFYSRADAKEVIFYG